MMPPKIRLEFYEHPDNPMPADGQVHAVTTDDGYDLRLGLWPAPGFKIEILKPEAGREVELPEGVASEKTVDGEPDAKPEPSGDPEFGPGTEEAEKDSVSGGNDILNSGTNPDGDDKPKPGSAGTDVSDAQSAKSDTPDSGPQSAGDESEGVEQIAQKAEMQKSLSDATSDPLKAEDPPAANTKNKTGAEPIKGADTQSDELEAESNAEEVTADSQNSADRPQPGEDAAASKSDVSDKVVTAALDNEKAKIPAGTIILLNGRCEFIEKYFEVIGELIERNFCVAALDWRGQGGSERLIKGNPRKGHIDDMDSYVEDLVSLLDYLETTNCPKPYFCLAHSTGGQVLIRAAPIIEDRIARAVTTAPFLALAGVRKSNRFAFGLASTLTYAGLGELFAPGRGRRPPSDEPFEGNVLTADPQRYERTAALVNTHQQLAVGGPTISWVYAALKSAREITTLEFLSRIHLPILMLTASEDRIVSSKSAVELAMVARTISQLSVPGARHEILMERDEIRHQFWAAFDAFIPGGDKTA